MPRPYWGYTELSQARCEIMFGQVLDKIDTYFGRVFILARYMPWLLCVAINGMFAFLEFPIIRAFVVKAYDDSAGKAVDLIVLLLLVWVVAYTTAPLVHFVTRFLEGEWMPHWLARLMIITHSFRRDELEREYRFRFRRRADILDSTVVIDALKKDRSVGAKLRKIGDPCSIEVAEKAIASLRVRRLLNDPIELNEFQRANDALSLALTRNCAEPQLFLDPVEAAFARKLHELHEEMGQTLSPYVLEIAEHIENRALGERQRLFADKELAPTRLGND